MAKIKWVKGRQILDSRGNPTVEADVVLESGELGRAAVPSGASTGSHEAIELRDQDPKVYQGMGVMRAVGYVNSEIANQLVGHEAGDQKGVDECLVKLDGTDNKSRLGANAILAVSLACAKAEALAEQKPLYRYVYELTGQERPLMLPVPLMNIVNGGKHAAGSTDIQEFMILPLSGQSFAERVRLGAEVFHALKAELGKAGYRTTVGDEGGFAPTVKSGNQEALELIKQAVQQAGYELGRDISFGLDVAATELYEEGRYSLATENKSLTTKDMIEWLEELRQKYPIISIEDGLAEDDWGGWTQMNQIMGQEIQLVGDDLLVTNTKFLERAIKEKAANAILIKPNQIGTLTETIAAVALAHQHNWRAIISHRSGETEDTTIAHLVVGLGTGQIKTGSMSRTDRVAKYNELIRIEEELGAEAQLASWN